VPYHVGDEQQFERESVHCLWGIERYTDSKELSLLEIKQDRYGLVLKKMEMSILE